ALKYYTGSKIVSAIPGIGKATAAAGKGISALSKGKIGVDLATRVAAGQAATLPVETANAISEGIQNKKSATDIGVDILKRQAMNLGFDVGTEATGKLLTLGAKKIAPAIEKARAGKALDKADIGLINDTAKQVSDGSITSKVKKVIADLSRFKDTDLSDFNTARKSYIEYAQKNFPKSVVNAETNMHIDIPRQGLEKLLSGKISTEKYASAFHVPELIENAKKVGEAPYLKSKENIFKYDYFDSPIAINEKEYMAHIRVRETNMGNKYYGHTLSGVIDDIKIEPSARSYVDESTLHPVNALGSNNSISQTNKNINREIPIETANAISENVQNNSGSWKDRSYTQNEKTYVQSEDGLRMYEVPKQNEINYHVEKDGTVSLNEDVISHLDQRDYRDFIKTYAEKNLITKIDPRTGEMIDAKPIIINSTGDDIIITQTGINEVMKKMRGAGLKSRDNVASMLLLNKIIQQANMNHSELNRKGRINPHTYYDSRFAIDGRQYHVKLDIKNVPAGDRYYYHSLENIEIGSSNGSNGLNP
ncbi:MAG: hypothetical protein N2Z65_01435, partial [Clostridiales bacterium]|nr:hypothetical protein [Clostridiales bacterium]